MSSSTSTFYDQSGRVLPLDATPIGRGGEATVYSSATEPGCVIKIYHPSDVAMQHARANKLLSMIKLTDLREYPRMGWPRNLVCDEHGVIVGFTMRKLEGTTLVPLTAKVLMARNLPHWGPKHVCRVAHDIAALCKLCEAKGIYIGDINLGAFIANKSTAEVALIDCDSLHLKIDGQLFPSKVYTEEFQAPEVLAQPGRLGYFGPEQFRFSAALLFFTLFTAGGHPFNIKGGASPKENILRGRHWLGGRGIASGSTTEAIWNRYRALSPRIAALAKRTFIDGHSNPSRRPGFDEWIAATRAYYAQLS